MTLPEIAIKRHVTMLMLILSLVALGAVAVFRLPLAFMPDFDQPMLFVRFNYPNASPSQIERLFGRVRDEFGSLDIFVNNARGEVGTFYEPAMSIGLDKFDAAMDSQAKAFLVGVREAATLMPEGGRVIAITYAPGGRYGSWQSWVGMGAAKSALEGLADGDAAS